MLSKRKLTEYHNILKRKENLNYEYIICYAFFALVRVVNVMMEHYEGNVPGDFPFLVLHRLDFFFCFNHDYWIPVDVIFNG